MHQDARHVFLALGKVGAEGGTWHLDMNTRKAPEPVSTTAVEPLSVEEVAQRIIVIRGQRVLLDTDLARFYGESTKRFNQQVRRNQARFLKTLCSSSAKRSSRL